ncbi:YifB family Mg chelatase-like AAA ATPase [Granulosicoccaceae sp. 1_MG-2023]|nr:YifB family Mg chelatase-like AAA ATPase [Granulosicoccaceae sp. 1_MG-2023]
MSLAVIPTCAVSGVTALAVNVEVHLGGGLPSLSIVGLPETAVRESKDRVRAALLNAGFEFPARRITINLAPADLPKHGGRFDLPIAIGILTASGQLPAAAVEGWAFVGELALGGEIRGVAGVLPSALFAAGRAQKLVVPQDNRDEAALAGGGNCIAAPDLLRLCGHFSGGERLPFIGAAAFDALQNPVPGADLVDVKGQHMARRALEIAAAGGHNLLFSGPPGTGKSMLASRLPGILPPMTRAEALETASVASVSQAGIDPARFFIRPFRAPHHTASGVALVGGGSHPKPGEISLAHNGVLFLDELPEFSRQVLEVLREPLETGHITISRAGRQADFPARFQLVAAMNPCPCGHFGDEGRECRCTPAQIARYQARVSGPFLDRIDLRVSVGRLDLSVLRQNAAPAESSAAVRQRVLAARERQLQRAGVANAGLNGEMLQTHCRLSADDECFLESVMQRLQLSMRAYARILRTARTIADLAEAEQIGRAHLLEALNYRNEPGA